MIRLAVIASIALLPATLGAASATHFDVSAPQTVGQSMPFSITVTALDASNAPATNYRGTAVFTCTIPGALPDNYTFVAADNGIHQFTSLTLEAPPSIITRITVTDAATPSITGNATIYIVQLCPPQATMTAPASVCARSVNNTAFAPGGTGTTFAWTIENGVITSSIFANQVTFTAGDGGYVVLHVLIQSSSPCGSGSQTLSIPITPVLTSTIPESLSTCRGQPVTIPVTLTGTPPFTLVWSDGVSQVVTGTTTSRVLTPDSSSTLTLNVGDRGCNNLASSSVKIAVDIAAAINVQPQDARVLSGSEASFSVDAGGTNLHYAWFRGALNDTSKPVGGDSPALKTGPITSTESYWVRVSNGCGNVSSSAALAIPVAPRRRAAGH